MSHSSGAPSNSPDIFISLSVLVKLTIIYPYSYEILHHVALRVLFLHVHVRQYGLQTEKVNMRV